MKLGCRRQGATVVGRQCELGKWMRREVLKLPAGHRGLKIHRAAVQRVGTEARVGVKSLQKTDLRWPLF
jgi:hypothetical protein